MPTSHENKFLLEAYRAYQRKNTQAIKELISSLPDPIDESLLASLTESAWEKIGKEEKKGAQNRTRIIVGAGILGGILLIGIVLVFLRPVINPPSTPTPEATLAATLTRTTPATTPPSAATSTETPTPTETVEPVSVLEKNPADILPALPAAYVKIWLFNDDSPEPLLKKINITPGLWFDGSYPPNQPAGEKFQFTSVGGFELVYTLDRPLPATANYDILVMDTPMYSSVGVQYEVMADGEPVEPISGTGAADFQPGVAATWLVIGTYPFKAGQTPEIRLKVDTIPEGNYFASDRLVIGQFQPSATVASPTESGGTTPPTEITPPTADSNATATKQPTATLAWTATKKPTATQTGTATKKPTATQTGTATLKPIATFTATAPAAVEPEVPTALPERTQKIVDELNKDYRLATLAALWDANDAEKKIYNGTSFNPSKEGWMPGENGLPWGEKFIYFPNGWKNTLQVIWGPEMSILSKGLYRLMVWVPGSNATATAQYYLLVDRVPQRQSPARSVDQQLNSNQWADALQIYLDQPAKIQVVMEIKKGAPGDIAIDFVALLRMP